MGQIRKHDSPSFKAQVVLELLKETRSVSELAAEYGVHRRQLHRWRNEALEKLPQVFVQEASWPTEKARYDAKMDELYAEIGRLTAQLSWLKKKGVYVDPVLSACNCSTGPTGSCLDAPRRSCWA